MPRRAPTARRQPEIAPASEPILKPTRRRVEEIATPDDAFIDLVRAWHEHTEFRGLARFAVRAHPGKIHLVDVDHDNADNFSFSLWGCGVDLLGQNFTSARIVDHDWPAYAAQTLAAYTETRDARQPRYDVIHLKRGDYHRRYGRLLLPTTADGRPRLIVAINPHMFPGRR